MALPQCSRPFSDDRLRLNSPMNPKESCTLSETIEPYMFEATQWYFPLKIKYKHSKIKNTFDGAVSKVIYLSRISSGLLIISRPPLTVWRELFGSSGLIRRETS